MRILRFGGEGKGQHEQATESTTSPWRSMIARRRWFSHRGPQIPRRGWVYNEGAKFNKQAAWLKLAGDASQPRFALAEGDVV